MSRKRSSIIGACHLCQAEGVLSFEHIPPRKAFNDSKVTMASIQDALASLPGEPVKGKIQQRGAGKHSLCVRCNSDTGRWYGADFVRWTASMRDILVATQGRAPRLLHPVRTYPLRVLKQVVSMICSLNASSVNHEDRALQKFVLDRRRSGLHPAFRFYVYLTLKGRIRQVGTSLSVSLGGGGSAFKSEMAFPPLGYLMVVDGKASDPRLVEITDFGRYGYDEVRDIHLRLPLLETHTPFADDYPTLPELRERVIQNEIEGLLARAKYSSG